MNYENTSSMSNSEGLNKKPGTAYFFFMYDIRPTLKKEFPDLKLPEMVALMGQKWRELPLDEKRKYEEKSILYRQQLDSEKCARKLDLKSKIDNNKMTKEEIIESLLTSQKRRGPYTCLGDLRKAMKSFDDLPDNTPVIHIDDPDFNGKLVCYGFEPCKRNVIIEMGDDNYPESVEEISAEEIPEYMENMITCVSLN